MSHTPRYIAPAQAARLGGPVKRRLAWWRARAAQRLVDAGAPAGVTGNRYVRHFPAARAGQAQTIHPAQVFTAPLPLNVASKTQLPGDPGWWGFSLRDVPERRAGPTQLLHLGPARVLAGQTEDDAREFAPAIVDSVGHSLDLREIRYRPFHSAQARRPADRVLARAIWIAERVFDNHSHWLSAHLPKLVLLRDRGLLAGGDLVLPTPRPARVDASLRALGIDPDACHPLPIGHVLETRELIVVASDRFRPELLGAARQALVRETPSDTPARILISRKAAAGRKLVEKEQLQPMLAAFGFTPVAMEDHDFAAQVRLMAGAEAVLAPHGAGLTNMLFCAPGTKIFEIADPAYPNPNFYAMAAALGLPYALIEGKGLGGGHPLHQDLSVDAKTLREVLEAHL